ncbi:MAG: bifunctional DNA-formamidopyrimidine glycosylase/DNA-(apurinic or apyrimidinic site) lyase [Phycisphaerae bacterium]|nr:bifunctional DNA-formamidopyrimidine glycosylase/DNA-(apurinic or apyrimidinic site) lyase [Phycisphaerae bacterium]
MPELPEVENIAIGLRQQVLGLEIKNAEIARGDIVYGPFASIWQEFITRYQGSRIKKIIRRAKRLIILYDNDLAMLIQLGMTGKFLIKQQDDPVDKHTHMTLKLCDDRRLCYVDPRRFGRVWLLLSLETSNAKLLDRQMCQLGMGSLGPEATGVTTKELTQILDNERLIKTLLLDQTRIAGLGNIYVDESLFATGIHPETKSRAVTGTKIPKLAENIRKILKKAIKNGGTTFSDYRNAYGEMGKFKKMLYVYGRDGQPCRKCGCDIEKIKISGRSSHFCPKCQK